MVDHCLLRRVKELAIGTRIRFIDHGWLKLLENDKWDVLAGAHLRTQGRERIIAIFHQLADRIFPSGWMPC
jgi:hypothetical protein